MSSETLEIVDTWFREQVQCAPLSYHTECYNQMHAAYQDLRTRLGAEPPVGEEEPPAGDASGQGDNGGGQSAPSPEGPGKQSKPGK